MPYSLLRVGRVFLQSHGRRLNRPIRNSALALRSRRLPAVSARSAAGKPQLSPVEMPEVQHEPRERHDSLIRRWTARRAGSIVGASISFAPAKRALFFAPTERSLFCVSAKRATQQISP